MTRCSGPADWCNGSSRRQRDIEVLAVTDGEASHPLSAAARAIDLAAVRTGEVVTSLRHLGWDQPEVTRLGIPDGHVDGIRR